MQSHPRSQCGPGGRTRPGFIGLSIVTATVLAALAACTSGSTSTDAPTGNRLTVTTPAAGSSVVATRTPTAASAAATTPAASAPLVVDTSVGRLHGEATSTAREFLGVRYARSPTGARRWTMPVPTARADNIVEATQPGASCAQAGLAPGASATASVSEDCLFLNVTTPKTLGVGEKLPVMVWWHGGGFTSGAGSAYDAGRLASRGRVIVVTVNYRLGIFGYLSLPGLAGSGDFGLADQILATGWAKQNAAAFGGDPGNVTVFGESAGAASACALLSSPAAKGLVDKVAMSSGGVCQLNWPQNGLVPSAPPQTTYLDLADAQQLGITEAKTLGCAGPAVVACLRGKSVHQLLTISPLFSDVLAYRTPLLPQNPATAVKTGQVQHIPILSSGNRDEERAFVGGAQKVNPYFTAQTYPTLLRQAYGADANKVAATYPLSRYPSAAIAWSTVITDQAWACPTLAGNAALAAHGSTVYAAEFADPDAPDVNMVRSKTFDPGAAHASDIPYLFDLLGKNYLSGTAQTTLSNAMVDYWTTFARTGTPTAPGEPAWPHLAGPGGPTLQMNPTGIRQVDLAAEHHCDFWSTITVPVTP